MTVVIGAGVVLSPGTATDPNNPLVGWHSLVALDNVSADVAETGYPASNLANPVTSLGAGWRGTSRASASSAR